MIRSDSKFRSKDTFLEMSTVLDKDYKWTRLPGNRDENVSENKANQVKYLRDTAKKIIKEMKEQFFYAPSFKLLEDLKCQCADDGRTGRSGMQICRSL